MKFPVLLIATALALGFLLLAAGLANAQTIANLDVEPTPYVPPAPIVVETVVMPICLIDPLTGLYVVLPCQSVVFGGVSVIRRGQPLAAVPVTAAIVATRAPVAMQTSAAIAVPVVKVSKFVRFMTAVNAVAAGYNEAHGGRSVRGKATVSFRSAFKGKK